VEYDPCSGSTLVEEILCRRKVRGFEAKIHISEAWRLLEQLLEEPGIVLGDAAKHRARYFAAKYVLDESVACEVVEAVVNYVLTRRRGWSSSAR
jgi:hypothetical protein